MTIRPFLPSDAESLVAIYRDAVLTIAPQAYTPEQVAAWSQFPDDLEAFRLRMTKGLTLLAETTNEVLAFGQLHPNDHLDFLYCRRHATRKGIGTQLYFALEKHAQANGTLTIHTEASHFSRPFFTKHGYTLTGTEQVIRSNIPFTRFLMQKTIPSLS